MGQRRNRTSADDDSPPSKGRKTAGGKLSFFSSGRPLGLWARRGTARDGIGGGGREEEGNIYGRTCGHSADGLTLPTRRKKHGFHCLASLSVDLSLSLFSLLFSFSISLFL